MTGGEPEAKPTEAKSNAAERARRERNIALGLVLAGFAALFFVMTIVRLGGLAGS